LSGALTSAELNDRWPLVERVPRAPLPIRNGPTSLLGRQREIERHAKERRRLAPASVAATIESLR